MLRPGERATQIVLWDLDDPATQDDPHFRWSRERPLRSPGGKELTGPKGISLAALRERCGGDEIEICGPGESPPVRISTSDWPVSDPERTYVIVSRHRRPTAEEAEAAKARRGGESPFPPEAEALRQEWLAVLEAGEEERADALSARFDAELRARGWLKPYAQPDEGLEIAPGVYLLDTRPPAAR